MLPKMFGTLVAGFVAGLFLASFLPLRFSVAALFLLIAVLVAAEGALARAGGRAWAGAMLLAVLMLGSGVGIGRYALADLHKGDPALEALVGSRVAAEGIIVEEPDLRDATVLLSVELEEAAGRETREKVLVIADRFQSFSYGDRISLAGTLKKPEPFETESGRLFDYPAYLAREGVFYEFLFPEVERVGSGFGNPVRSALFKVKGAFLERVGEVLPEPHASLLAGLLLGAKQSLGKEIQEELRRAGIVHIVVLSGYNMTLVAETIMRLASLFFLPAVSAGVGVVAIALFAVMAGGSAAAIRAALMALIVLLARLTGRTYDMGRALFAAGALMLLQNPKLLAFDPSFQLSFIATLGLVVLAPKIQPRFVGLPLPRQLREFAVATVATQLAVTPLLIFLSGEISLVALPANLLVLIVIPTTMLLGFVAALLGFVHVSVALPFAFLAYLLLAYILGVGSFFAALPFATISFPFP